MNEDDQSTMFCPKCGTKLPANSSFCGKCGISLQEFLSGDNATDEQPNRQIRGKTPASAPSAVPSEFVQPKPRAVPKIEAMNLIGLDDEQAGKAFNILRDAYQGIEDAEAIIGHANAFRTKLGHMRAIARAILVCAVVCAVAAGVSLFAILNYRLSYMWQLAWGLSAASAVLFIASLVSLFMLRSSSRAVFAAQPGETSAQDKKKRIQQAIAPITMRLPESLCNKDYVIRVLDGSDSALNFGNAMVEADRSRGFAGRRHAFDHAEPLSVPLDKIAGQIVRITMPGEQHADSNTMHADVDTMQDDAPHEAAATTFESPTAADNAQANTGDGTSVESSDTQTAAQSGDVHAASDVAEAPAKSSAKAPSHRPRKFYLAAPIASLIASVAAMAISVTTLAWAAPMRQREFDERNTAASYCSDQYQRLVKVRKNADDALGKVQSDANNADVSALRKLVDDVDKESCSAESTDQLHKTAVQYQQQTKQLTDVLAKVNTTVQAQQSDTQKQLDLYSKFKQLWESLNMGNPTSGSNALDGTYCRKSDGACLRILHRPTDYQTDYQYGTLKYAGGGSNPLFDAGELELDFNYQSVMAMPAFIESIYLKAGRSNEMCGSAMNSDCTEQHLYYAPAGMDLMAVAGHGTESADSMLGGNINIDSSNLPDSSKPYLIVGSVNAFRELEDGVFGQDPNYDGYGKDKVSDSSVFYKR
ncbi:zinc ribbon domain-containing protein [Bifidobacterium callitrichidarum]|nr:zinc ribbon domain-containing protein [Bifidobacterium callitrichidarum]